ncbi:MAG: dUTP diphosphatase [Deltaproteobacteria bacterium]|nr:dUTP diphosphatase [Deltaproteobacteria bacterium]
MHLVIEFKRADSDSSWPLPTRGSEGASGLDLSAHLDAPVQLAPGEIKLIPTGWCVAIPLGYEGQVRPRSGVASKRGLTIINTPGTIDSDYRGEIFLAMINLSSVVQTLTRGERLGQLVISKVARPEIILKETLSDTVRGSGAFGSTGS